jgi:hypothetical protein
VALGFQRSRGPNQFFVIKPDIVDLELDLMQTDICGFHCDSVPLRDSLRDEVGRGY